MEKSPIRLIVNRIKPHMMEKGDMLGVSDVLDILAIDLIGIVPDDESVVKSANAGEPLTISSNSPAAKAFTNIAARLVGDNVPFMSIDSTDGNSGLFDRLKRVFGL
jgi:septum site-determining protein MinD